ncbi:response regulator [Dyadobacter sp. CY323]|uniref:response regulator n=1 Tax=Dyadobacter sp. CY323 TaxID=2907302 RepID=UPI001F231133|nr:response regulator [Dyadobacter sp. CY323]MCE6989729.1 response regulator [Dyadobacter sp. CY323]
MIDITTIFIADDDEDDRMFIREALQAVMVNVRIVECADAVELLDNVTDPEYADGPKLILLDMNMPKIHGLETVSMIRADKEISHIPVVMLSTGSHSEQIKTAYIRGINAYITKPVYTQGYIQIAEALNTCFLNNYTFPKELAEIKRKRKTNVLLIEDNEDEKWLMSMALTATSPNIHVTGIHDEENTLQYLSEKFMQPESAPQLILLDLYLPARENGLNLLDAIKTLLLNIKRPAVPIIIISHSNAADDISECYRQRANAYVVKSTDMNSWAQHFSHLCYFWMDTVAVPNVA